MNKYEKCATSLMQLGDKIIAEKKHRKAIIMRSTALSLGAAGIIGLGICANALKPPKKPTVENSGIITETTTVISVETTVKTSVQTGNATANAVYTSKTTVTGVKEKNRKGLSQNSFFQMKMAQDSINLVGILCHIL